MNADRLKGLVLAGGESRRMGSDKALLQRDGRSQLGHAVELLERHVQQVCVSVRPDQADEPERSRYRQVIDRYQGIGPLAGILSAMDADPRASWLVLACDLPNVDDETIATLVAACDESEPFVAYRSAHDGLPEPLCAVWTPAARPLIDALLAEGVSCPRKLLIRAGARLIEQPNPASLDNMNTPQDLEGTGVKIAS